MHKALTALADRLERVVEQAARTRKATAAVGATRELRQTLVAIADIQANPDLQRAASEELFQGWVTKPAADCWIKMIDLTVSIITGLPFDHHTHDERSNVIANLLAQCLRLVEKEGVHTKFSSVDRTKADAYVERLAFERAARIEAEVQRRVEAELARRERQARPAIEAREVREIEGGAPLWST